MKLRLSFLVVLAAAVAAGCSTASKLQSSFGNKYRYSYLLVSPSSGMKMSYQDSRMKILFRIDDSAIRFRLHNKTNLPMRILWDQVSMGVRNRFYAVRNTRTLYLPGYRDNAVPTIKPGGYVIDMAIPAENIGYVNGRWVERDLIPTTDRHSDDLGKRIQANKGSIVELALPLQIGETTETYTFRFQVTDVKPLPWERYRYPFRPTPPPLRSPDPAMETDDQVMTAVIVAAVVGVSAIFLTQKKAPPSE